VEALLVEILTDSVSAAKLFDLTESAANVTAVPDLDSLAKCRTRGEVEALDGPDLGSVEGVQGVWGSVARSETCKEVLHRVHGLDTILFLSRGGSEARGTLLSDIGDAFVAVEGTVQQVDHGGSLITLLCGSGCRGSIFSRGSRDVVGACLFLFLFELADEGIGLVLT
jgi:hypothetical protein